jgi:hypothetical protein
VLVHADMNTLIRLLAILSFGGALSAACASAAPPPAGTATTTAASVEPGQEASMAPCVLECGNVTAVAGAVVIPDHHAEAVANADAVFAAMHDDLVACYRPGAARDPHAHAFITVDVVLNPDGTVRSVATTGGAMLGDPGLACISRRVKRATFAPVWGGGTLHLSVPMSFKRLGPDETT